MDAKRNGDKADKQETQETAGTQQETKKKKAFGLQGLQLLLVQSAACVLVILLALVLRLIGGDIFASAGALLKQGLTDQTLISTVVSLFDFSDRAEDIAQTNSGKTDTANAVSVSAKAYSLASAVVREAGSASSQTDSEKMICAPLLGGEITSRFGEREDPFDTQNTTVHNGLDIAAPQGTTLFAMMDGVVVDVDYEENGYGHHMIVQSADGNRYLYAHCSEISVCVGDRVSAGEAVAKVGSTGRSTGPHLHIEWYINGERIDPALIVPEQTYA
ncbi:MAG: M23 family metallopeptidase [Acutalibacteraceae bacterium]